MREVKKQVIASLNNKGGVLKTTTLLNMAVILANKGYKVLVIDADGQGNATASFPINKKEYEKKYEVDEQGSPILNVEFIRSTIQELLSLESNDMGKLAKLISEAIFKDVYVFKDRLESNLKKKIKYQKGRVKFYENAKNPSEKINSLIKEHQAKIKAIENEISEAQKMEGGSIDLIPANSNLRLYERHMLRSAIESGKGLNAVSKLSGVIDFLKMYYDFILIDAPPALGMISENIMAATNKLVVPMELEKYSIQGINNMLQTYWQLKEDYPYIGISAVLPTKVNTRLGTHKETYSNLKNALKSIEGAKEFYDALVDLEDGVNLSGQSASQQMKNNDILSAAEWFIKDEKKHQNVKAYIKLVEEKILK